MAGFAMAVPLVVAAAAPPTPPPAELRPDRTFLTVEGAVPVLGPAPFVGLRVAHSFGSYGLELGGSLLVPPFLQMADLSAFAWFGDDGPPAMLRAGVTAYHLGFDDSGSGLGYHLGLTILNGTRGRIRWRIDYTHHVLPGEGSFGAVGAGLVVPLGVGRPDQ